MNINSPLTYQPCDCCRLSYLPTCIYQVANYHLCKNCANFYTQLGPPPLGPNLANPEQIPKSAPETTDTPPQQGPVPIPGRRARVPVPEPMVLSTIQPLINERIELIESEVAAHNIGNKILGDEMYQLRQVKSELARLMRNQAKPQ